MLSIWTSIQFCHLVELACHIEVDDKYSIGQITLDVAKFTNINDKEAESVEQDQTARMCSLILIYTLRKN